MKKDIMAMIQREVAKLRRGPEQEIAVTTALDEMGIDSLDLFSLIEMLEAETGKTLPNSEFEGMTTVKDLVSFFGA